ncbi:MAG TPA: sulfite exporter TauE/SafE family protein [Candidatus Peribacteraceae bacterium]|nr:sulfite exporter TauE/SafE family protein [Candidatus Peribacteraceae bacterium]
MPPLLLILPILFLGAIFSTIAGGGLGILITIVSTFFIDVRTSIILVSFLGFAIHIAKLTHFHRSIRWDIVWWYVAMGIPASFFGAFILLVLPERALQIALGILCLVYVFMHLFHLMPKLKPTRTNLLVIGAINGTVGGVVGHGALLRMPALLSFGLTKEQFVGTSAFVAFLMNLAKGSVYATQFPWSQESILLIALAIPVLLVGVRIGKAILHYVSEEAFERLLLVVIVGGAVKLLFFP